MEATVRSNSVTSFFVKYGTDFHRKPSFSNVVVSLSQLIENGAKPVRGPYLGRLELHHTMTELNENGDDLLGDFLELLVEYFRKVKRNFILISLTVNR